MGTIVFIAIGIVAVALGMVFAQRARILRALRKVPVVPIAEVKDGVARITGTLGYAAEPLIAPLTGRRCAYYEAVVEQHGGKGSWRTVVQESRGQDFFLRDDTGKALVHLDSPLVAVVLDAHMRSGFGDDAPAELEEYLRAHGTSSVGLVFNKTLRYREGVLEEGELVSAMGVATWEPDPDPDPSSRAGGYREAPMRLELCSSGKTRLHASDDPAVLVGR